MGGIIPTPLPRVELVEEEGRRRRRRRSSLIIAYERTT